MTRPPIRSRRVAAALVVAAVPALLLSGCLGIPQPAQTTESSDAVGFDDLQTATVYIKGQGTFVDPGTLGGAEGRWIGSGFLVSDDGLVVTNNHVVAGAGTLDVLIGGEDEVSGKVLGASECLDLAVIQLDEGDYPHLAWREDEINTGLDVYSAGFPLGAAEEFTLTRGIVSKDGFPLDTDWASVSEVIEHDARIRGGNSGGPLVDEEGHVVGVNYAGDDSLDYNYAIHRDAAEDVVDDLAAGEDVQSIGLNAHAWVSDDGSLGGVWAQSVTAGSAADEAGIEPGDLVVSLAGVTVGADGTLGDYCEVLDTQGSDGTMDVTVYRPETDELLEGEINGDEIEVTQTGVFGGGEVSTESGFTTVQDDSGVITVSIPGNWSDVDGSSFTDGNGVNWYSVAAAPSLADFYDNYGASGIIVNATAELGSTAEEYLSSASGNIDAACTPSDVAQPYDDSYYVGVYSSWDCSGTFVVLLSTLDSAGDNVVLLTQLNGQYEQEDVLTEIVSTFSAAL